MSTDEANRFALDEAADRAAVPVEYLEALVANGVITPTFGERFSDGDVRRVSSVRTLTEAGVAVEALAAAIVGGTISLGFLDNPVYERLAVLTPETFRELGERAGIPLEGALLIGR